MMVVAQPEDQLAFEVFAFLDGELCVALWPPFMNATVSDKFATTSVEQSAGISAAKELLAP